MSRLPLAAGDGPDVVRRSTRIIRYLPADRKGRGMRRPLLAVLVVLLVAIAGCSSGPTDGPPDGTPSTTAELPPYPDGWGQDGVTNRTTAVQTADGAVGGADFAETLVFVRPAPQGFPTFNEVTVIEIRVDYDAERAVINRRLYEATNETASEVVETGLGALSDTDPYGVQRTYVNATAGVDYRDLPDQEPTTQPVESGSFATVTSGPAPFLQSAAIEISDRAFVEAPSGTADGGLEYAITGMNGSLWESASGTITLTADGLVTDVSITGDFGGTEVRYDYEAEVGDLSVDRPEWA